MDDDLPSLNGKTLVCVYIRSNLILNGHSCLNPLEPNGLILFIFKTLDVCLAEGNEIVNSSYVIYLVQYLSIWVYNFSVASFAAYLEHYNELH